MRPVVVRGHVWTNDPAHARAEAVLVRGRRVEAVGRFDDLYAMALDDLPSTFEDDLDDDDDE